MSSELPVTPVLVAAAAGAAAVGRLVDCSQADDRRLIRLVRERRLLYARNNMPVASYYAQVKSLWDEVAAEMGWTVPEVRRKWSHVRNSYSRHLRNELGGARTGRGRAVSRWHLADELEFLRDHMATDTRTLPLGYQPNQTSLSYSEGEDSSGAGGGMLWAAGDGEDVKPFAAWHAPVGSAASVGSSPPASPRVLCDVKMEPGPAPDGDSFAPDENSAYFQFFRGIYEDYRGLSARRQRRFRRQSLELLHRLLDEQDGSPPAPPAPPAAILPND